MDNLRIPKELWGTVKYTQEERDRVKEMWKDGISQRAISRETGISRRYISFILFPERLKEQRIKYKERALDGRYYKKEVHRKAIKATRDKKRALFKKGII